MATNTGRGFRRGFVKSAVQYFVDGYWYTINNRSGIITQTLKPRKGVRKGRL